jgi:hypothetical protein
VSAAATPRCPLCGQPPRMVLDDGRQSFCGNADCMVIFWAATMTVDELMADIGFIEPLGPAPEEQS